MNLPEPVRLYPSPPKGPEGPCWLVETWGSDEPVIMSARMSTDGRRRGWGPPRCDACEGDGYSKQPSLGDKPCPKCKGNGEQPGDEKLLRYLWTQGHHTPFQMAGAIVEMPVPISGLRQVQRPRAASLHELLARYTEMPDTFWLPHPPAIRRQGTGNKQGSPADLLSGTSMVTRPPPFMVTRPPSGAEKTRLLPAWAAPLLC